jgi:hypothetical protein
VGTNGLVYVAWQDSRFSGGAHDGIALSSSQDGGLTWTTPLGVNGVASAQAFTPTVNVRSDGMIAVTYYDLRSNDATPISGSLFADSWLVTSADGTRFVEQHLSGAFDLLLAPQSPGPFLGEHQALVSTADAFLPFYVQTNAGTAVSSDAFIAFPPAAVPPP